MVRHEERKIRSYDKVIRIKKIDKITKDGKIRLIFWVVINLRVEEYVHVQYAETYIHTYKHVFTYVKNRIDLGQLILFISLLALLTEKRTIGDRRVEIEIEKAELRKMARDKGYRAQLSVYF
ncbi:hypothetical protein LOAG_05420 [Loa loa]|uniref:Uncharacterized protein n=1 Tax=Loa loa TaxID=7209 RepID=A0A1S0U0C4_LOALO|nr:hypothetical protein LOAG_05420 [Loa loa]EFO23064.1 hypothetical protein LOAG_05420 [Loa loa]